ncbi:MAG: ComF family protein [Armatimonadetes bacterium]|nr:ComF family protein [Armatimonadota bacterium]
MIAPSGWRLRMGEVWEAALDLVYPTRCVACDRLGAGLFCDECRDSVEPIAAPHCERCQEPDEPGRCPGCRHHPPAFRRARVAGRFEGSLRDAIHALKYEQRERVAAPLTDLLAAAWERAPELHGAEAVVPLPIHARRERERGFNQSALLAGELSERIGLPALESVLTRPVYRKPQVGLNREERHANVEGVFHVEDPEAITGLTLLLIDDVLTTGATCHAAAQTLMAAGAKEVFVLALAREPYRKERRSAVSTVPPARKGVTH